MVVVTPVVAPSPVATRSTGNVVPLSLGVQVGRSGSDLRVALLLMLQDDAYLGMAALQAAGNARLEELIAANASLDQNATSLSQIVTAVNGQPAGQQVLDNWRAANSDLVHYAQGGQSQQDSARHDLEARRSSIANSLAVGEFTSDEANNVLNIRFQQQLSLADAVTSRDAQHVLQTARDTSASGDDFSRAWAAAIAAQQPDQVPTPTEGADVDVRANFARLYEERVYLLADAEAAAADRREADTRSAAQAVSTNGSDIAALISSAYGSDAANAYSQSLQTEANALESAAGGGNRDQAATDLDRVRGELDTLVATQNAIMPRGLLADEFRSVDQSLLAASDAFTAHDFTSAYEDVHGAAKASQRAADSLSQGIVDRFPIRFMVGTPTAGGGPRRRR